jgi:hypothetical protein
MQKLMMYKNNNGAAAADAEWPQRVKYPEMPHNMSSEVFSWRSKHNYTLNPR